MTKVGVSASALALLVACTLTGCAGTAPDPTPTPAASATPAPPPDGAAVCTEAGGTVQTRQPTFGTNNDESAWIPIGDAVDVCRFQTLGDEDESRIYVDLVSISSTRPTLAALAYLSRTPLPDITDGGNPATENCTALEGTSQFGESANGGGFVNEDDPIDVIIAPCVFADGSFIEQWGIAYYSDGTARGIDLADVFQFDESDLPPVYG